MTPVSVNKTKPLRDIDPAIREIQFTAYVPSLELVTDTLKKAPNLQRIYIAATRAIDLALESQRLLKQQDVDIVRAQLRPTRRRVDPSSNAMFAARKKFLATLNEEGRAKLRELHDLGFIEGELVQKFYGEDGHAYHSLTQLIASYPTLKKIKISRISTLILGTLGYLGGTSYLSPNANKEAAIIARRVERKKNKLFPNQSRLAHPIVQELVSRGWAIPHNLSHKQLRNLTIILSTVDNGRFSALQQAYPSLYLQLCTRFGIPLAGQPPAQFRKLLEVNQALGLRKTRQNTQQAVQKALDILAESYPDNVRALFAQLTDAGFITPLTVSPHRIDHLRYVLECVKHDGFNEWRTQNPDKFNVLLLWFGIHPQFPRRHHTVAEIKKIYGWHMSHIGVILRDMPISKA